MVFTRKKSKRSQNSSGSDLSEQAMNDSVRAAQIIFQKHASSQSSMNGSSTQSSSHSSTGIVSPQPRYKKATFNSLVAPSSNGKNSLSQIRKTALSPPERSESAQAAAQLAAAHWNQLEERESLVPLRTSVPRNYVERNTEPRKIGNGRSSLEAMRALSPQPQLQGRQIIPVPAHAHSQSPIRSVPPSLSPAQSHSQSQIQSQSLAGQKRNQDEPKTHTHLQILPHSQLNISGSTDQPNSSKNLRSSVKTSISKSTSSSTIVSNGSITKIKDNKNLPGRVPPPKIYFDKHVQAEAVNEYENDNIDDNDNGNGDYNTVENVELYSMNSVPTSNSCLSSITDRSSFGSNLPGKGQGEDDENNEIDEEEKDYEEDEEDEVEDEVKDESDYSYARQNNLSSSSVTAPLNANYNSTAAAKSASATYEKMSKIDHANVTYQGTLPDLIPNHTRQSRMEKLKTKIFGSRSRHKLNNANDQIPQKSSTTSNENGRPVVTTNQNMRFKTTMRGKESNLLDDGTSNNMKDRNISERYNTNEDGDSEVSSSDSDNYSIERIDEKKRRKRTYRLKRRLKSTAAAVPYTHHLHNHDHRYHHRDQAFNEDKPWKSHNDVGFVTPKERKRYEGMWVSNRCLYLELLPWWDSIMTGKKMPAVPLPEDGLMLNIVVKDIWSRSNLPNDLLLQIYDKVDTRKDGTLDRKSFIVGMWLVDQSLYGRKLPRELSQQVWDSVDKYIVNVINPSTIKHIDKTKKRQMKQEIKNIKKEIKNTHL